MFNKRQALERRGKIGPASSMAVLVQAIENERRVIDELFRIMGTENEKQKKSALVRLQGPNGITSEEYDRFKDLNPEIIRIVIIISVTICSFISCILCRSYRFLLHYLWCETF